ncbi:MAG TPA: M13 family metallopeptidase, partial [Myxococcaceae bacterium]|nr:M13 family metallopeptidase [Myxococcaceae bacterium]
AKAEQKARAIFNKIAYPDKWKTYDGLVIDRQSFLGNFWRSVSYETDRDLRKIGKPLDRGEWRMTPPTVNAYYSSQLNTINFPAGILQPPYFDPSKDESVNYGAIGGIIGHEIIHGFDRRGRWRDGTGALHSGWTEASIRAFDERAACVRAQSDATPVVGGMTVNGAATLDEDLADLGGLRLALLALQERLRNHPEPSSPGLSPEQQLFLGWGQLWCTKASAEAANALLALDVHAPHPVRVNAPLRNLPEFARAFGCPASAPMVAHPRCEVW